MYKMEKVIDFSIFFRLIASIAWKIKRSFDRMLNFGLWIRFAKSLDATITPTAVHTLRRIIFQRERSASKTA